MKKIFKPLKERGVTLVEMLIVMGLLSVLLLLLATVFTAAADVQNESRSYSSVLASGRFIMARLNYDIAHASAISSPSGVGSSASTLTITVGGNSYTYTLSGNDLTLTDNVGTDNLNSDDVTVSGLSFDEVGNGTNSSTISYSFTLTSVSQTHSLHDTQTFTSASEILP